MKDRSRRLASLAVVLGSVAVLAAAPATRASAPGEAPEAASGHAFVDPGALRSPSPGAPLRVPLRTPTGPAQAAPKVSGPGPVAAAPGGSDDSPRPRCPAPCFGTTFDAIGNVDFLSPGDPTGAGGDAHVVTAVNSSLAVYSKTGVEEVAPVDIGSLVPGPLAFSFDPKVVYDQYTDTYVLAFVGVDEIAFPITSRIYLVSIPDATAATPATWCGSWVRADQGGQGKQVADFPGLGYDEDRVYVATNQFGQGWFDYFGAQILAFDKTDLYDCTAPLGWTAFSTDDTRSPDGRKAQSLQVATSVGPAPRGFFLGFDTKCPGFFSCVGSRLTLFRVKDGGAGLKLTVTTIAVPMAEMTLGTQKGAPLSDPDSEWDVGDLRLGNAFYDGDLKRLYGGHAVAKDLDPGDGYVEAVGRWYEVEPMGALKSSTVTRRGNVGEPLKDAGWPAVATDSLGNVFMTFSRASGVAGAKEYLGAWATLIEPGKKSSEELIQFGFGSSLYAPFSGPQRWGDYNAINRDPTDGTVVWMVNQYAASMDDFQQVVTSIFDL
ncbi:MAG: hypothetical protein WD004_00300 [Actinomycetota bacterium]